MLVRTVLYRILTSAFFCPCRRERMSVSVCVCLCLPMAVSLNVCVCLCLYLAVFFHACICQREQVAKALTKEEAKKNIEVLDLN
jgi:hypothetical protein